MDKRIQATVSVPAAELAPVVADLSTYPDWHSLVHDAERAPESGGDEGNPAWLITLRAKIGPFARSKRLRMVRRAPALGDPVETPRQIRFERHETDGKDHSDWVMTVDLDGDHPTDITIGLHYSGQLWDGLLEPVLERAIKGSIRSLESQLSRS